VFGVRMLLEQHPYTEHTVRVAAVQTADRQQSGDIIPHAVTQSCAPEDVQRIARNMLS